MVQANKMTNSSMAEMDQELFSELSEPPGPTCFAASDKQNDEHQHGGKKGIGSSQIPRSLPLEKLKPEAKFFPKITSLVELFYATGRTFLSEIFGNTRFLLIFTHSKHLWTERVANNPFNIAMKTMWSLTYLPRRQ